MAEGSRFSNADFLNRYFSGPPSLKSGLGPSQSDIAKFIVLNADRSKMDKSGTFEHEGNEPSLMGRIFDILSRPNYAMAELAMGHGPAGFLKGLAGTEKTTFSDVLEHYDVGDDVAQGVGGFILDVALDPTTYIPGGALVKGAKAATKGVRGGKAVDTAGEQLNLGQKMLGKGQEPINPELYGRPSVDQPDIPIALKAPTDPAQRDPFSTLRSKELPKASDVMPGQLELPFELGDVPKSVVGSETNPLARQASVETVTPELPMPKSKGQLSLPIRKDRTLPNTQENLFSSVDEATGKAVTDGDPQEVVEKAVKGDKGVRPDKRDVRDSESILADFDPSKAQANLNRKYPESLNAKQQVKLYYKAREAARARFKNPNSPANAGRIDNIAVKIYQAAEQQLEARGFVPRIGTGENVRLSEVIREVGARRAQEVLDEFGNEIKTGSDTWQAIANMRARGAIDDSKSVKMIVEAVQQSALQTEASKLLSDSQLAQVEKVLKKIGGSMARAADVSPAGIKATEGLLSRALNAGKSAATLAVESQAKMLDDIVAGGKAKRSEVNKVVTRALEKDLGDIPRWAQTDNKAVEFMMGRFATWWGQKDLRPLTLNAIGSAVATAQARGKALEDLFRPFSQPQRHEAFRLAKGIGTPTSEGTYQLATQIKRLMDNMVGQVSGQSVVLRSAVDRDMLNKWMGRYGVGFKFSKGHIKTSLGQDLDLTKGTDWLDSWKAFEPTEDPMKFLFKFQQALEQATREKALFDEIGERFGQRHPGGGWRNKIDHVYLDGYYFTDDIAKQLPRVIKDWSLGKWNAASSSPVIRLYDRVLSMWKTGVTIYRPGHHIRNVIGDVYLGWMDGVNSVKPYRLAAQVQRTMKDAYPDLMDVDKLVEVGILGRQYKTPVPGKTLFRNRSGVEFTAEQIGAVAHQKGLLEHTSTIEDIIDLGEGSRFKPFGGRVQKVARSASELQSHNARLAHFIDKVMKSKGSDLEKIFEDASRRARKWHPSGLDLTDFERQVMRRLIPFYSWLRKSAPILIEGLVMNPGKTVIPAKLWQGIQETQGIETPGRDDPFPVDQMFPSWIRAEGLGPISTSDGFLGRFSDQTPAGYVMGGMGINPLTSFMADVEDPGKTVLSSMTPVLNIPMELLQGRKSFTGEPITGRDAAPGALEQYIGEQIPIWSAVQGVTGITPFGTETKQFVRSEDAGTQAVVNWLTGLGVRGTGPSVKQGRYERILPQIMEQRSNEQDFLADLRSRLENYGGRS